MVNRARGETALILGDATYRLRPSYAALVATEVEMGPLFALIERAGEGRATLADVTALLWHCLDPRPEALTRAAFGQALFDSGLVQATQAFRAVLEVALGGDPA